MLKAVEDERRQNDQIQTQRFSLRRRELCSTPFKMRISSPDSEDMRVQSLVRVNLNTLEVGKSHHLYQQDEFMFPAFGINDALTSYMLILRHLL